MRTLLMALGFVGALALAGTAQAQTFDTLERTAYGPYRQALFQTGAGNREAAVTALESAVTAWAQVMARFGEVPPAIFTDDAGWTDSLERIAAILAGALEEARAGQLAKAHDRLEEVRDLLGEVRRRNGVIRFSDHVNAYHAALEEALKADPERLREMAGVLAWLDRALRTNAPAAMAKDPEFIRLADANTAVVERLRKAARSGDAAEIKGALQGLKPTFVKLFLAFG